MSDPGGEPVLVLDRLSKTFPGTRALDNVSLEIGAGEVHALVGVNGSGKSTLIKTLAGVHRPDPGSVAWLNGKSLDLERATAGDRERMRFVHQDLGLIVELSAVDNLALSRGYARTAIGSIRWRQQEEQTERILARFGVRMDLRRPLAQATPVERTMVAIAAALQDWSGGRGLLVLDEPTAVLPAPGVERLFSMVGEVRRAGTSVLYVSHRLDEIFRIADKVSVIRGGRIVGTAEVAKISSDELATLIVGRDVEMTVRPTADARDDRPVALQVRGLRTPELDGVDLTLRKGEILGVTGLAGSGAQALAYAVAGATRGAVRGELRIPSESDEWQRLEGLRENRFPLVPADRASEGVVAEFDVHENMTLRLLRRLSRRGFLRRPNEVPVVDDWIQRLSIVPARADAPISSLSGGNQQKVLMARCLAAEPSVLVLSEPTAGVDIGARQAIYDLVIRHAEAGLAVLVSSADTDDIVAMCTRVLVLRDGRIFRELTGDQINEAEVHHAADYARL